MLFRHHWILNHRLQETPEESYYRQNLPKGRVSHVQAMDKALESMLVAALARFFSHLHVHLQHQAGQGLSSSCQKRETENINLACPSPVQQAEAACLCPR